MALLDQLFRLRGAPRGGNPPVTLGAVVADLEPPPSNPESREVPAETGAPKAAPPPSLDATSQVPQVTSPPPGRISSDVKPAGTRIRTLAKRLGTTASSRELAHRRRS